MEKVSISIVTLGSLKHIIDFDYIVKFKSVFFKVNQAKEIYNLENANGDDWSYSCKQLLGLLTPRYDCDITIGIINAKIEKNYYMHILDENTVILSLYEMDEIILSSGYSLEDFIIRNIYEIVTVFLIYNKKIPNEVYSLAHDDTRGCLFDINANKTDIIFSMQKPTVCQSCRTRIASSAIDHNFIDTLHKELKRIKRSNYYTMTAWVKKHPILSLAITALSGLILDILANLIYDNWTRYLETIKCVLSKQ